MQIPARTVSLNLGAPPASALLPSVPTQEPDSAQSTQEKITDLQDALELKALAVLRDKLDTAVYMMKPMEVLKIAMGVNAMKRRTGGALGLGDLPGVGTVEFNQAFVKLELPEPRHVALDVSREGQIVGASGRTLITASETQIVDVLMAKDAEINGNVLDRAAATARGNFELAEESEANARIPMLPGRDLSQRAG